MEAYRFETVLEKDGILSLTNLPLVAGVGVEVILLVRPIKIVKNTKRKSKKYPLRGIPITYIDPTEPVALSNA